MKNLSKLFLFLFAFGLASCGSTKYMMSEDEAATKGYSLEGWHIMKDGKIVGTMTSSEWEINHRQIIQEISIKTSFSTDNEMKDIARYMHLKFPECKIEVNSDAGNSFPNQ